MPRITPELLRKRSEHNEGTIYDLEEIALHQESIEELDLLGSWCRDLKILLLQSNLIPRIENLNKLKMLEYLNLALNNIERIENLEGCESLNKLDMTLNFIGEITSVQSLSKNIHLKTLYLTGNPCCDFPGYRKYVIANVPTLKFLDGEEVTKSDRLEAVRILPKILPGIIQAQNEYFKKREKQREMGEKRLEELDLNNISTKDPDELNDFWNQPSENTPETRIELSRITAKSRESRESAKEEPQKETPPPRLFSHDGRPLNVNKSKLDFVVRDEPDKIELDLAVYKYLDSSLLEVDVQPWYVYVSVKGKPFQYVLPDEIFPDKSKALRSQTTGHLLLTMPKVNPLPIKKKERVLETETIKPPLIYRSKRELLEIGPETSRLNELIHLSERINIPKTSEKQNKEKNLEIDFQDNPEVPPLE